MEWVVYILQCSDSSLYTGITNDLARRITEHNEDNEKGARYTRGRRPVTLMYKEFHENRSGACKREYQIKQLSRAQKLKLVNK